MIGLGSLTARWRVLAALSCVLLLGSVTDAEAQGADQDAEIQIGKDKESNDPIYAGGNAPVPSGKRAVLDASDERVMRILWQEGVWELPYDRITNLYVSLSRPSAMVELGGLFTAPFMLGALKDRKLYLSVSYSETNEIPGKCIFLVRQGYGKMVVLLAERSKHNVVFEAYDAKRRLTKPN
jgi:hypothetical protein